MKKALFYPCLWGILTLSTLSSCRTEDNLNQQKQIEDNRFATFIPKSGKTINYADGFAYLMKRYDNLHKTNLSGVNNKPVIGTLASSDKNASVFQNGESYVESNIRSQTVTEKDDIKWVAFPKVQGNKVISLVVGMLTEKGTRVTYRTFGNDDDLYKQNIVLFQAALDKRLKRTSKLALNASLNPIAVLDPEGCSDPYSVNYDPRCKDIEEVIINIPKPLHKEPNPGNAPSPPPLRTDPDGKCADYGDCSGSSGNGSGGDNPTNQQQDPCSELKTQANDEKFKTKVSLIDNEKVLGYDHEMGYAAGYPPAGTGITDTQYPPMDNKPGTTSVRLPEGDNYFGFMHTHNNYNKDGNAPIKIFSPADIVTFLTSCVRQADEKGSMSDAYAMVITSQGNYILKYSGDGNYNIGPNQIKNWEAKYRDIMLQVTENESFTQGDIEKAFAQFLKDVAKVDGLEVYQSEKKTGATSKINADGTKNPC